MGYYIIIRGPLGIGKTTIAKKLSEYLKADYYSMDEILVKAGLVKNGGDYTHLEFIKANDYIIPEVREKLSQGKNIVFDGNFYFKEQLEHLLNNLPYESHVFTLKAPLETCVERDAQRERPLGRLSVQAIYNLTNKFDYGLAINADRPADNCFKDILKYFDIK